VTVVAYTVTHNEGQDCGVLTGPGESFGDTDLYEADIQIRAFATVDEANAWINDVHEDEDEFDEDEYDEDEYDEDLDVVARVQATKGPPRG
jgi:hypothetical protein